MSKPKGPPVSVWVAWCATCKKIVMADTKREPQACPYCRPGQGHVKFEKYVRKEST